MFMPQITVGSNYVKQKMIELQGETEKSTIIVRDFSTPLSIIARTS